jgi:hypothetical protein
MPAIKAWRRVKGDPGRGEFGYGYVRWRWPENSAWGPFPVSVRATEFGRTSSLVYPVEGEGWYTLIEIDAMREFGDLEILDSYIAVTAGPEFPWFGELADLRLRYKSENDSRHIVLKYGLNSAYGKLAQRVGKRQWSCEIYAGQVTSHCRAVVGRLLQQYGHEIVAVATDGILSLRELPLTIGNKLGEWESSKVDSDIFVAQSGLWWCAGKVRTRGFEPRYIDEPKRQEIVEAWLSRNGKTPSVTIRMKRFFGYRTATHLRRPESVGKWVEVEKRIYISPYPRRKPWKVIDDRIMTVPAAADLARLRAALELAMEVDYDVEDETPAD